MPQFGSKGPARPAAADLVPGPVEAEPIVAPAFAAIGRKTVWLVAAGQGSRTKLVVNSYLSFLIEGVAEALELGHRLGIARPAWTPFSRAARSTCCWPT